jgi:23S rRNA (uracil1939-C5)-methyltransferase
MPTITCSLFGTCGGCRWGGRPIHEQQAEKIEMLQGISDEPRLVFKSEGHVRDKVDLVWQEVERKMRLGLYGLHDRHVIDIETCPMMSEELHSFFVSFRAIRPPIKKGSVRLRISPAGERGLWLDFANQDVKFLFGEKTYLRQLSEIAFVEIGQRRKALEWRNGEPKLTDPVLRPWFQSYDARMEPIPLFGPVGGFSQVGFAANKALVGAVAEAVALSQIPNWIDLFCGNGNFTLALAARGRQVKAVELDEIALAGLKMSLEIRPDWRERVEVQQKDIYRGAFMLPELKERGLIVDPPRSGLRELLNLMEAGSTPPAVVYVSCHTESFLNDTRRLRALGYHVRSLVGVDQFPQSAHCEWVALFTF